MNFVYPHKRNNSGCHGYGAVEFIIIIIIFAMAAAALLGILKSISHRAAISQTIQTATDLALQEFERVTALRFSVIADEPSTFYAPPFEEHSFIVKTGYITAELADSNGAVTAYKKVEVTVSNKLIKDVKLTSIMANN